MKKVKARNAYPSHSSVWSEVTKGASMYTLHGGPAGISSGLAGHLKSKERASTWKLRMRLPNPTTGSGWAQTSQEK